MTDISEEKNFLKRMFLRYRVGAAESVQMMGVYTKLAAVAMEKFGAMIPKVGAAKGAVLAPLCDKASEALMALGEQIRGGYEIKGMWHPAKYLSAKVDDLRGWLSPARIGEAVHTVKVLAPDLKIPGLTTAPAPVPA